MQLSALNLFIFNLARRPRCGYPRSWLDCLSTTTTRVCTSCLSDPRNSAKTGLFMLPALGTFVAHPIRSMVLDKFVLTTPTPAHEGQHSIVKGHVCLGNSFSLVKSRRALIRADKSRTDQVLVH